MRRHRKTLCAIERQAAYVIALERYLATEEANFAFLLAPPPSLLTGGADAAARAEIDAETTDKVATPATSEAAAMAAAAQGARRGMSGVGVEQRATADEAQTVARMAARTAARCAARCAVLASGAKGGHASGGFVPSYEWVTLGEEEAVLPPGLEVDLPLDGRPRRARIPPSWHLRKWLDDERGFWRMQVERTTTFSAIRHSAAQFAGVPLSAVQLFYAAAGQGVGRADGPRVDIEDEWTVEDAALFSRVSLLQVRLTCAVAAR